MNNHYRKRAARGAFSLIELMVSMGILTALLLMMTTLLSAVQESWRTAESRIGQFREARVAFDLVSKNLSQATMNTYWDLKMNSSNVPEKYERTSELHFITLPATQLTGSSEFTLTGQALFFQAPLGSSVKYRNLNNLFNARGYFVGYGGDKLFRPSFVKADERFRFRLLEFRPPAEENQVFQDGMEERVSGARQNFTKWFNGGGGGGGGYREYLNPLAENIITLVVAPRDSINTDGPADTFSEIAPNYQFDSNNEKSSFAAFSQQVPPLVRITMIAIDEASAQILADESGAGLPPKVVDALQGRFANTKNYDKDIEAIITSLIDSNVKHKVFSTLVMLRSAKWSTYVR